MENTAGSASPSPDSQPDPTKMERTLREILAYRGVPQGLLFGSDGFEPVREIAQRGLTQ